jgi:hypothetical protein
MIISRNVGWRACKRHGELKNEYSILAGESEGRTRLGRPNRRWQNNIIIDREETGLGCGLDSSGTEYGPVTSCEHSGSLGTMNSGEFLD